jgi:hypothetical protein
MSLCQMWWRRREEIDVTEYQMTELFMALNAKGECRDLGPYSQNLTLFVTYKFACLSLTSL